MNDQKLMMKRFLLRFTIINDNNNGDSSCYARNESKLRRKIIYVSLKGSRWKYCFNF